MKTMLYWAALDMCVGAVIGGYAIPILLALLLRADDPSIVMYVGFRAGLLIGLVVGMIVGFKKARQERPKRNGQN